MQRLVWRGWARRGLCLGLCLCLLAGFSTPLLSAGAWEDRAGVVTLSSGTLNVRAAPGGDWVGSLANGASVTVTGTETDGSGGIWYRILYPDGPDGAGYVSGAYIAILPDGSAAALENTTAVVTAGTAEIWSAPDTALARITVLGQNSRVTLLNSLSQGDTAWYYIKTASGLYGYCQAALLTVAQESQPGSTREEYMAYLGSLGFPASYQEALWQLHLLYPSWEFRPFATGLDWASAVEAEHVLGRSLVPGDSPSSWKSTQDGAYNWTDSTWYVLDSGGWVAASREIIAYYMDPRNFLDASSVFQFLYQGFDGATQTQEGLVSMVAGTFLADTSLDTDLDGSNGVTTYTDALYQAGSAYGVSPYVLASMMIQEMGSAGISDSISGTNSRFPGYYNAFNLGAFKDRDFTAVERGLWYASGGNDGSTSYGRPWTSLYKAIMGGAEYYAAHFVANGQSTLYLKRFNVQGNNLYENQYMTNAAGAQSEGRILAGAYSETMRSAALVFYIPVFNNMPDSPCPMPTGDGSPNTKLASLSVSAGLLSPEFNRDVTEYTVIVPNETTSISVTAAPLDGGAVLAGTGEIALAEGSNTVTVTVTAPNGSTGTYTITVIRRQADGPVSFTGSYSLSADGRVTGVAPGTTAQAFLAALGVAGGTAELTDSAGAAKDPAAVVGTGDVLHVYYQLDGVTTLYGNYAVLIYGDVNGDGAVLINDLIKVRNHLLGTGVLTGLSLAAADANRDGTVLINDLIKVRNHIAGTGEIQQ